MSIKTILAPTDFSELSAEGLRYACQLAKDTGAALIILNVAVVDESNTVSKTEMERHRARLDEFVAGRIPIGDAKQNIRKIVVAGQPYGAILDCAGNEGADLIVMSSHGRTGLSRMLIGSVTDKILRGSSCPVLVVPVAHKHES
ncbi:MAG TPA: universal stress protein [Candidatus Binatia bacterium]|nr:universal stress protein [Candidatus Binatia bacterium]